MTSTLNEEVKRRRTFAIISHPDAGKTTLTEALLYHGGAIREAGAVKGKKNSKHATSDWMEIEQQRGISVTSSVLQITYNNCLINILDTPGHQDFSEDTYRTLTAVDSAVMLIDIAKGVEPQTIKLFKVCRDRGIPIFTFINKMDRYGKAPLDVLQEIEDVLGIESYPMNWPIGLGQDFCGVYNRHDEDVQWFAREENAPFSANERISLAAVQDVLAADQYAKLEEDLELLDVAGNEYDKERVAQGQLTPAFFGSALADFGIDAFLQSFIQLAPSPHARLTRDDEAIDPTDSTFTGFVFKIQANMNPAHRDRVAFIRICSGVFERGMRVKHVREGKEIKLSQPQQFLAQDRDIVDSAYPGDIIGVFDPGHFHIGDTLTNGKTIQFEAIPSFPPEHFAKVRPKDAFRHKQFEKGMRQLTQEGAIQRYTNVGKGADMLVLGAVGELQFQVFEHRMNTEYGVDLVIERLPHQIARWVESNDEQTVKALMNGRHMLLEDVHEHPVLLFETDFSLRWFSERHPDITLTDTAPLA